MRPVLRTRLPLTTSALIFGIVVASLSLISSDVPDAWEDEAATLSAATRSWPELIHLLGNIDAVHGLYYALMKVWFGVVGTSVFTMRLPSAVAVGVGCALTMLLASRLGSKRVAVITGVVYACLPRVAWAAVEGRPYAMVMVAAVGLTLLFVRALERDRKSPSRVAWLWYGLAIVIAVLLNIYLAMIVVMHAVILAVACRSGRSRLLPWLITAGSAAALLVPFALLVVGEAAQVHWIPELSVHTIRHIVLDTWFRAVWPIRGLGVFTLIAVPVGWVLLLVGVRSALKSGDRPTSGSETDDSGTVRVYPGRALVLLAFGPMVLLLTATALGKPLFAPYYLTLSAPFVAILMAIGIAGLTRRRRVVAVVLVVAVAIPSLIAIRLPHSHHEIYWSDAAELVHEQRESSTGPDAVVFATVAQLPSATANLVEIAYPVAFEGMRDLAVTGNRRAEGRLFDRNGDLATLIPRRLASIDNVWIIGASGVDPRADEARRVLETNGFAVASRTDLGPVRVLELHRSH